MVSEHVPLPQERLLQFSGGCPAGSGTKRTGRGLTSKSAYGGGTAAGVGSADDPAVHADPLVYGRPECAGLGSEEHTSELQSLMRISYAVFCLKQQNNS